MEDSENYFWVPNYKINQVANLPIEDFVERVENVVGLRCQASLRFSLFPTNENEIVTNNLIWDYVNDNRNALNQDRYVFNLKIPKPIYYYLRQTDKSQIFKPIVLGLAARFIYDPTEGVHIKAQIHNPLWKKIELVIDKYFKDFQHKFYEVEMAGKGHSSTLRSFKDRLDIAYREYAKNSIIFPFVSPFEKDKLAIQQFFFNGLDIEIPIAYMNPSDWELVVLKQSDTELWRAESESEPMEEWRYRLEEYHPELEPID